MNHHASGSNYHRLLQCSWWAHPSRVLEERTNEAAETGTETHGIVAARLRKKTTGSTEEEPEEMFVKDESRRMASQAMYWLDDVDVPTSVEIAIAYDAATDTARRLTPKGHRDYGQIGPYEIPTTLDLVWDVPADDCVIIRDLKTGKKENAHREQLILHGLAATRLFRRKKARIGFLFARKTKSEAPPLELLTEEDLDAHAWQASSVMRRLPTAKPEPGDHCFFCPARQQCPAFSRQPTEEERKSA